MPTLGVNVAVLDSGRVLMTKREDYEVWSLPGGHVEAGESFADAAIRETFEETGLAVELTRLVGSYSRPRWRDGGYHIIVFAARPTGGALSAQVGEVLALDFFSPDALPTPLLLGQRQRVDDVFNGRCGIARTSLATWPFASTDEALRERDASPLSRSAFYERFMVATNEHVPDVLVVPGVPAS